MTESAYGILINVAGRGSTSNPARPQVGLTQQNLMALYTTLNSFDPNNPNANRGVIEGELRSLGFSPTEISRLLGNPALAQMMAPAAALPPFGTLGDFPGGGRPNGLLEFSNEPSLHLCSVGPDNPHRTYVGVGGVTPLAIV